MQGWWIVASIAILCCVVLVVLLRVTPGGVFGEPARNVLLLAGGIVAVVGVGLSLSRHREELDSADRDRERLAHDRTKEETRQVEAAVQRRSDAERGMRARFVTAVELLSDDERPMKRAAGLRSLSALADDWAAIRPEEVKVCVDTICDYLRQPVPRPEPETVGEGLHKEVALPDPCTPREEIAVRLVGYQILRDHLIPEAEHKWGDRHINLSGALVDFEADLGGIELSGGRLDFRRAEVCGGGVVNLDHSKVSYGGRLDFTGASIHGSEPDTGSPSSVDMTGAHFDAGCSVLLSRAVIANGATVTFKEAKFNDGAHVETRRCEVANFSDVRFVGVTLSNGAYLSLTMAIHDDARVVLSEVNAKSGGWVILAASPFGTGRVDLDGAVLDESDLHLDDAVIADTGPIAVGSGRHLVPGKPPPG